MNIYNVYFRWSNFKSIPKSVVVMAESKEQAEQSVVEELTEIGRKNNCGEPIIRAIKYYGKT
jgi:hypothetical protein